MKKQFRILVVEDSQFFNELLIRQLEWYTADIASNNDCKIDIDSFMNATDCLNNLKEDTDVAFLDYYLEDGKTAVDIVKQLNKKNRNCKVIILSHAQDAKKAVSLLKRHSVDFIYKDENALSEICSVAGDLIKSKLKKMNTVT